MNDVRPQSLIGTDIFDRDGVRLGRVGNVYVDDATHEPEWVTVRTGLLGMRETFVPLTAASVTSERIDVEVSKDQVRDAPRIDAEHGHLSDEQGQGLYDHYGVDPSHGGLRSADEESRAEVPPQRRSRPAEAIPELTGDEQDATTDGAEPTTESSGAETTAEDDDKVGASTAGGRHHSSESTPSRYRVSGPSQRGGKHRKQP